LSCAVALAEAGSAVVVVADAPPARTVSAVAGGLWFPYGSDRSARTLARARATYQRLESLVALPEAGVAMVDYLLLEDADPWWARALPPGRVRRARPNELPRGYAGGHVAHVPLVQPPRHLEFLEGRARALGVSFESRRVEALSELTARAPVVVNCAGLGARELCGDTRLSALRGQVVHLRLPPGLRVPCVADDDGPNALAYILPRPDVCVAGGTAAPDDGSDLKPDPATREAILARCDALVPGLSDAEVVADRVGRRPVRSGGARLELEAVDGATVIHDYGHGGAGWTLAWGCAEEVRELARHQLG
jgi:D-amino-acid oxidase